MQSFVRKEPILNPDNYNYKFNDPYIALQHFNYEQACLFYGNNPLITVDLIKALTYWNEQDRKDHLFLEMVGHIIAKGEEEQNYFRFVLDDKLSMPLPDRYVSGIIQGKMASLLVRAYVLAQNERYLLLAQKCLNTCLIPIDKNGSLITVQEKWKWIEEYPATNHPSMVLNGQLFSLIGLAEYLHFHQDKKLFHLYKDLIDSTLFFLPAYKVKSGLLYSLYNWKYCNVHYLGIMQPLCEHMFQTTSIKEFKDLKSYIHELCPEKLFHKLIYT